MGNRTPKADLSALGFLFCGFERVEQSTFGLIARDPHSFKGIKPPSRFSTLKGGEAVLCFKGKAANRLAPTLALVRDSILPRPLVEVCENNRGHSIFIVQAWPIFFWPSTYKKATVAGEQV